MIPFITQHPNWLHVANSCYWNHLPAQYRWKMTRAKNTEHLQDLQTEEAITILERRDKARDKRDALTLARFSATCGSDVIQEIHNQHWKKSHRSNNHETNR